MLNYVANDQFHKLNQSISQKFFSEKYATRYYQNSSMALYDLCFGLQQFLAHKPMIGLVKNGTSLIESILPCWLRISTPLQIKMPNQTWAEYIELLSPETNYVIWSSENEITGEILVSASACAEIHEKLSKKRIYSIQITNQISREVQLQPYTILLYQPSLFEKNFGLTVFTEKMKSISLVGNFQDLNVNIDELDIFKNLDVNIKEFEKKIKEPASLYFNQFLGASYLSDRLVFSFKNLNAEALKQQLNLNSDECFTPASCPFWVLDLWKNWWKDAENEAFLRGLIVISIEVFKKHPDFSEKMNLALLDIQRLSRWNVL